MTPIRSILMIAATLTLISSASAQGPELPSTALGYRSHLLIPASFVHAVEASELAVLNPLTQVLGTAQVRHNSWRHRTRTLTVSAASLDFGAVTLNSVSTRSVTLQSTGTSSVTVSAMTVSGIGFAVAGPALPFSLSPGQAASIQLSFDPTVAGAATGSLAIATNSSTTSIVTVSLSGTGAATVGNPVLTLSSTSLNFGSTPVGTATTQYVTLSSTGTSAVTVSSASLTGTGFTISGATFPVTLNPTVAIKLQVSFDPTVAGTATGTLTLTSNSSTGKSSGVILTGTGILAQHQVTLSWAAPVNSPAPVSGYNVYRAASGNTSFQILNTSADTVTSYVDQNVVSGAAYSYYVKSVDGAGNESLPSNQISVTIP